MTEREQNPQINVWDGDGYFANLLDQIAEAYEFKNRSKAAKLAWLEFAHDLKIIDSREFNKAKLTQL